MVNNDNCLNALLTTLSSQLYEAHPMKLTPYVALVLSLATASPAAAVTIALDDSVNIVPVGGELYLGSHATGGGAGDFQATFTPSAAVPYNVLAQLSVTPFPVTTFTGLTMAWYNASTGALISEIGPVIPQTPLFTTLLNTGQTLRFEWDDSTADASFNFITIVAPATVPLPSGYLLLGTALIGFGALRKRRA